MPEIPEHLHYSPDHLWVSQANESIALIGLTDYAQQSLGDAIDVRPPAIGTALAAGEPCGEIESTKSVSDLIAPVTGTVESRNERLTESPDLINSDPYEQGWILKVQVDPATLDHELAGLMDASAYRELTGE